MFLIFLSLNNLSNTAKILIPIGVFVFILALFLIARHIIYSRLHKRALKTKTLWDDILLRTTRTASLLWSVWLGIYVSSNFVDIPASLLWITQKAVPAIFIALGVYTAIVVVLVFSRWYSKTIADLTSSKLDNIIIEIFNIGIPIYLGFVGLIFILEIMDINVNVLKNWLSQHGLNLALIVGLGFLFILVATALIPRFVHKSVAKLCTEESEDEAKKRSETLVSVLTTSIQVILISGIVLMVLSELNINITTILAGVGIAGIAIGFGAQSLVKDIIAGLFIIFENQYRKGDVVKIADVSGLVEEVNLRRTTLRDLDGIVHVIPNGEIRVASNFTKIWSRVNINISVSYNTDLDQAITIINKVGKQLAEDPKWSDAIITPPQVLRVDNFGDSGIEIKILGETKPIRQWDIMGELRLRLKREFDREGIEIPWPHTKVYFGNQPPMFPQK
jgi:moderate conductance mechanosensitive channel